MPRKKTTEEFIVDAYCKHGDRYNYKLVDYKNNKTKVKIICIKHGIFEQTPGNHISHKHGCKKCANKKHSNLLTKSRNDFIIQSKIIHNNKYDYSLVEYIHSHSKVKIICPEHGPFEQTPATHLTGSGCSECFINRITKNKICFIDKSKVIHNNKYDYSLVKYKSAKTKVKIICPEHGPFEQRPDNHLHGQGCPKCTNIILTSKGEIELQDFIKSLNIDIICNDRSLINPLELDIVIPSYKIAIEYNGLYWHGETMGKDKQYHLNKYLQCKERGYRLISIREDEWLFKQDMVKSIICSVLGVYKRKIGARQCRIIQITPKEARVFYNNNHIQGFHGGKHLGLMYKNELVSLMTIDRRGELQRFVSKKYMQVYGAFSKLLKAFNLDYIYTFADLRIFTGNVYVINGFKYLYTTLPNYYYFNKLDVYHRRYFQKKNIERLYKQDKLKYYNPEETEYVNMVKNGYDRIWDCGNAKFEWSYTNG